LKKIILFLFVISATYAQEITKAELIKTAKSFKLDTLTYQLSGDGFAFLIEEMKVNQNFMLGEYHNSSLVSKFTQSLFPYLEEANYKVWVTEISPTSVRKLNSFLDSKNFTKNINDFTAKYGKNNDVIPFFSSPADFEMLQTSRNNGFELWGLDQHYFGGFQFVMDDIYNGYDAKTKLENPTLLQDAGKPDGDAAFSKLFDLSKNKLSQNIKKEMLESIAIYTDYSAGRYYQNNTERSKLMKTNFYNYYTNYLNTKKVEPKAFFKLGSNHISKGLSPLGILDLGDFINQFTEIKNQKSIHIQLCYRFELDKNVMTDMLNAGDYPIELLELFKENEWIILDLRPLQARIYNQQLKKEPKIELSKQMIDCIKQFDVLILSPEKRK
jgi:hypothetical protein